VSEFEGHSLEETVEREYFPERFGFELFGDPYEKKRRWKKKQLQKAEAERGDLGAWERWEREERDGSTGSEAEGQLKAQNKKQKQKQKQKQKKKKKKKKSPPV
jgi:hypothetical protein